MLRGNVDNSATGASRMLGVLASDNNIAAADNNDDDVLPASAGHYNNYNNIMPDTSSKINKVQGAMRLLYGRSRFWRKPSTNRGNRWPYNMSRGMSRFWLWVL